MIDRGDLFDAAERTNELLEAILEELKAVRKDREDARKSEEDGRSGQLRWNPQENRYEAISRARGLRH